MSVMSRMSFLAFCSMTTLGFLLTLLSSLLPFSSLLTLLSILAAILCKSFSSQFIDSTKWKIRYQLPQRRAVLQA